MRFVLLCLLASACVSPSTAATPPARNFVCERLAKLNPDAQCSPEYTDVGERHTHSAVVTFQAKAPEATQLSSCVINDSQVAMICGPLAVVPQPQQEPKK
jgi:hypothetical protein